MGVTFRAASPADLELLLGFAREFYVVEHIAFELPAARDALSTLIADSSLGRAWLIEDDARYVGYVAVTFGYSLERHGRTALVDELFIRAPDRGRGIGGATLSFLESWCRRQGIRALQLEVARTNAGALDLYRRAGFEDQDRLFLTKRLLMA